MTRRGPARYFLCLMILVTWAAVNAVHAAELRPDELVAKFGKAVVLITTKRADGSGAIGTGYLVSSQGALITNFHVIQGAIRAQVKMTNGDIYDQVQIADYDERKDLAVLKVKGFNLPTVDLGDSDQTRVGERVYVIGNPQGLENSVSDGLLSGNRDTGRGYRLTQISAAISPGSSGSPVFNSEGKVIGTAVLQLVDGQNLNFAVPINYARGMISDTPKLSLEEFVAKTGVGKEAVGRGGVGRALVGHTHNVISLAWSPDSTRLASGSVDTTIRIWDAAAGKEQQVVRAHKDRVSDLQWSPDGKRLVSASADLTGRVYDTADGHEIRTLIETRGDRVNGVSWSQDGKFIAICSNGWSIIYDAETGKRKRSLVHASLYTRVAYSPDGKLLATSGLAADAATGNVSGLVITRETKGDWDRKLQVQNLSSSQWDIAWNPSGSQLATCGEDGAVRLWDIATNRPGRVFYGHKGTVGSVSWGPGGKYLASGGQDGRVIIWDCATGEIKRLLVASETPVFRIAWSPDGKRIAVGGGRLELFDVAELKASD